MAVFMITQKQRWLLQEVRNIFYYETVTGNPSTAEWQDICDEIRASWSAFPASYLSPDWEFYGIDYRQVDVAGLPSFSVVPTSGHVVGSCGTDSLPTQIAMLVAVKANTTKPNHARTYLGGLCENHVTDSVWGSGSLLAGETLVDDMAILNATGTNELQRVAVTWNSGHTAVVDYNNISAAASVGSPVPATQRRRRLGVGI